MITMSLQIKGTNKLGNLANIDDWKKAVRKRFTLLGFAIEANIKLIGNSGIFARSTGSINKTTSRYDAAAMTLIVHNPVKHLVFQERGVEPHAMIYLIGKTIPFTIENGKFVYAGRGGPSPGARRVKRGGTYEYVTTPQGIKRIKKSEGGLQFRKVTQNAIAGGKWHHPGTEPKRFFEKGIEISKPDINKAFPDMVIEVANGEA